MQVRYAFHPRAGEEIIVAGLQRYCGEPAYVGRQLDGSLALVPIWMTDDPAALMAVIGLVTVLRRSPISLCHLGFERERAYAAQI